MIPGRLKIMNGDATVPEAGGMRYIIHIVNCDGGWGAGFVVAVSKRWKKPEEEYRKWTRNQNGKLPMGEVQFVQVQSDTVICNMVAQVLHMPDDAKKGDIPLDYNALEKCLDKVAKAALNDGASISAPRIGCGLAGSSWDKIEPLVLKCLVSKGINVTIYDLPVNT